MKDKLRVSAVWCLVALLLLTQVLLCVPASFYPIMLAELAIVTGWLVFWAVTFRRIKQVQK